jgi:histidinol-phosphatase (PHP family)
MSHIESFVEMATARGVGEVGFTEHLYRCVESEPVLGPFWEREPRSDLAAQAEAFVAEDRLLSLDAYVDAVVAAKDLGLPVRLGLEVDYFPESIGAVSELLDQYPFDFLIGSTHWVGGWSIDHSDVEYEFERRGVLRAWEDYFAIEAQLAASGAVDVLAHVDVVKKRGFHLAQPPVELYRTVVEAAAASGPAVEVSTAGLHQPAHELYPSPVFLAMFNEAGVPITLASDAHVPENTGRDFAVAIAAAGEAGYAEQLAFDAGRRSLVPLPMVEEPAA